MMRRAWQTRGTDTTQMAGLMALIALAIRLVVAPFSGYRYDVSSYLEWTEYLAHHPLNTFYAANLATPPDHLPGDLLIFAGLGRFATLVVPGFAFDTGYAELLIRFVPISSDILLGLLLYAMLRDKVSNRLRLVAVAAVFFNPALFTVSAVWGQWDSFAALILMGIIALTLKGHSFIIWPLLTYLVLIKPQYAACAPILLVYIARRASDSERVPHESLAGVIKGLVAAVPVSVGVFFAVCCPFGVGLPWQSDSSWTIVDRIRFTVDRYDDVALGAHNFWALIGMGYGDHDQALAIGSLNYQSVGMALLGLGIAIAVIMASVLRNAEFALWCGSFMVAMSIYMFPTRVHERYLLPAIVFLLFMWPFATRLLPIALALSATYTVSLAMAMTNGELGGAILNVAIAVLNVVLFFMVIVELVRRGLPRVRILHLPRWLQSARA